MAVAQTDRSRLVDEMVEAYNARDVNRMLNYFADDAVVVDAEGAVLDSGKSALRHTFEEVFAANPQLHADVPTSIEVGNWVCIHSVVDDWANADGSRGRMEWVELYQVIDAKITRLQLFY